MARFSHNWQKGLGYGIMYAPSIVIVGLYFEKYRNLAFGIVQSSVGLGTVVIPFLITWSMETYAWRGSMFLLAGLTLNICVCGAIFRPVPKAREECLREDLAKTADKGFIGSSLALEVSASIERGLNYVGKSSTPRMSRPVRTQPKFISDPNAKSKQLNGNVEKSDTPGIGVRKNKKGLSEVLKDKKLIVTSASMLFIHAANFIPFVHLPVFAMENAATVTQATTLVSVIGICSIFSRLIGGAATNHRRVSVFTLYICCCVILALLFFVSPILMRSHLGQLVFAGVFGFWGNWCYCLLPPLTVELFSIEQMSTAFGIICFMEGIGILSGPPVAGAIYDASGSYAYGFYTGGGLYCLGALLLLTIPIEAKMHRVKKERELDRPTSQHEKSELVIGSVAVDCEPV